MFGRMDNASRKYLRQSQVEIQRNAPPVTMRVKAGITIPTIHEMQGRPLPLPFNFEQQGRLRQFLAFDYLIVNSTCCVPEVLLAAHDELRVKFRHDFGVYPEEI